MTQDEIRKADEEFADHLFADHLEELRSDLKVDRKYVKRMARDCEYRGGDVTHDLRYTLQQLATAMDVTISEIHDALVELGDE